MINYTPEQQAIIEGQTNSVVIAKPGSGKTTTVARIIQQRLDEIRDHNGVIAISYTNKASAELHRRALSKGHDRKCSFFGTIDRFFLSEIILPFAKHVFGKPTVDCKVTKLVELQIPHLLGDSVRDLEENDLDDYLEHLYSLYREGVIVLETVGYLAHYIFSKSVACRRYLKARYTDLIIDEYQDCGKWQHVLFLEICGLGIRGIAVGDLDQSIFSFAGKHSRFLRELAARDDFTIYQLTYNHRCHPSISRYATRFLSREFRVGLDYEPRIYRKTVEGSEIEIGTWLNDAVPYFMERYEVYKRNEVAILVKFRQTAALVRNTFHLAHKYFERTTLDDEASASGVVLKDILRWLFDPKITRREFLDTWLGMDRRREDIRSATRHLVTLENALLEGLENIGDQVDEFIALTTLVTGQSVQERTALKLQTVLRSESELKSYIPAQTDEVQVLTVHGAKGLEFDVVFHLDLYENVLPKRDTEQDGNLHYVALTRARNGVVLCTSTERHVWVDRRINAAPSPFLRQHGLHHLQIPSPI